VRTAVHVQHSPRHMTGFGDTLSRTFLDLLNANADAIRAKAELTLSSTA